MTDIQPISVSQPLVPTQDERSFFEQNTPLPFQPMVTLLHATSEVLTKFNTLSPGTFFLTVVDRPLGKEPIMTVCARRTHAILIVNKKKEKESFDFRSPVFKYIMNVVNNQNAGIVAMWSMGEFLVYLPEHDLFATFFPGVKSARPVALAIIDYMTPPVDRKPEFQSLPHTPCFKLSCQMTKFGPKNQAYVPFVVPITDTEQRKQMAPPDNDVFRTALEKFYQPVNNEPAVVGTAADAVDR